MANQHHSTADAATRPGLGWLRLIPKLTKAGLNFMVVLTTSVGFLLAHSGRLDWGLFGWTLAGTALAALGSSGLNQWLERRRDALMERTRNRPLPRGQMSPGQALAVSLVLALAGVGLLAWQVNLLTAALALSVQVVYITLYTPLKTRSPLCTLVGAYCGAVPPMMGFSAATGTLSLGAYILGALLFTWQIPHFLALAWLYREDYARGGHRMLPVVDESGRTTMLMIVLYALALAPISSALALAGLAGWTFAGSAAVLALGFAGLGLALWLQPTRQSARRVFFASIAYLPLVLLLLVLDRGPASTRAVEAQLVPAPAPVAAAFHEAQVASLPREGAG
jgi:heme o synthase